MAVGDVVIRFIADSSGFNATFDQVQRKLLEMDYMGQMVNSTMGIWKQFSTVGGASLVAMIAPTILASKALEGLDASMQRLSMLDPGFKGKQAETLDFFKGYARAYGTSVDEMAASTVNIVRMGYDYDQAMRMVGASVKFATVNQIEMTESAQILSYAYQQFGQRGGQEIMNFATLTNMMSTALNESALSAEDFFQIFRYGASSAAIMNVGLENFLALAAGLSQAGIQMGESWDSFFMRVASPENAAQLEVLLNVAKGSLVFTDDMGVRTFDIIKFAEALRTATLTEQDLVQLESIAGIRFERGVLQAKVVAEQILSINKKIIEGTGSDVVGEQAIQMAMTLENIMNRIINTVMAPMQDTGVIETLKVALTAIGAAFDSESFKQGLQQFILLSATFLSEQAPELINVLNALMEMVNKAGPSLVTMAQAFTNLAGALTAVPPQLYEFLFIMWTIRKTTPEFVKMLFEMQMQMLRTSQAELQMADSGQIAASKFQMQTQAMAQNIATVEMSNLAHQEAIITYEMEEMIIDSSSWSIDSNTAARTFNTGATELQNIVVTVNGQNYDANTQKTNANTTATDVNRMAKIKNVAATMALMGGQVMLAAGMTMMISSNNESVRSMGMVISIMGALTAAVWAYNAAMTFLQGIQGIKGAVYIAAAFAAMTAMTAMIPIWMMASTDPVEASTKKLKANTNVDWSAVDKEWSEPVQQVSTTTSTNSNQYNIFQPPQSLLNSMMLANGGGGQYSYQ